MSRHGKGRRPASTSPDVIHPSAALGALGQAFVHAIMTDFERCGVNQLRRLRRRQPTQYFRLIAALLPKEYRIKQVEMPELDAMSDEEFFKIFNTIRAMVAEQERAAGLPPTVLPDVDAK